MCCDEIWEDCFISVTTNLSGEGIYVRMKVNETKLLLLLLLMMYLTSLNIVGHNKGWLFSKMA